MQLKTLVDSTAAATVILLFYRCKYSIIVYRSIFFDPVDFDTAVYTERSSSVVTVTGGVRLYASRVQYKKNNRSGG